MSGQDKSYRTRDDLVEGLSRYLPETLVNSSDIAWSYINDAMALGATEQRRKDAEGQEPIGYISSNAPSSELQMRGCYPKASAVYRVPVYSHPANVAALEVRVKELEEAATDAVALIRNGRPVLARSALQRVTTDRAALTREGGSDARLHR